MKLFITVAPLVSCLGAVPIPATAQDCVEFFSAWRTTGPEPGNTDPPIYCNDEGICDPLYWVGNEVFAAPRLVPRNARRVTCREAATLKHARQVMPTAAP